MANGLFDQVYNPDVLSCLANLSNDEVFTPPEVVNQMLDMLPQELFRNPDTTFLDPACKTGVFLREIAKRLIEGLEPQIPDLQERIDHIFHKQLYGVAITELTSLLSRRSVYCSKYPSSDFSVSFFENEQGNIRFKRIQHTWENGKCKFCGANQSQYERGEELETHAYELLHSVQPEGVFNMKFDVIISNPPYQLSDGSGGSTDSAMPIYNRFIQQAKKLNPSYLCMIVPSKWMVGGRGLDSFRREMQDDTHIKTMHDFENASECFPGLHLDGGVCYFLWDKSYNGFPECTYHSDDGHVMTTTHSLKNEHSQYVIRDTRILSILEKTRQNQRFSDIVSATKPFGVRKYLFNEPDRYPDSHLQDTEFKDSVKIYGVKGIKGGAKRVTGFITRRSVTSHVESIDKYKIFFTTSYSTNAVLPPEAILAGPKEVCTETFLLIGPFEDETRQLNCDSYMHTNFFRFLLYYGKGTMQVNRSVFDTIPLVDFSKKWSDEQLFEKFNLTETEIRFINGLFGEGA